jgi:gamma-glutamyl-gamma-aminobutyrate hydrolase PuuD
VRVVLNAVLGLWECRNSTYGKTARKLFQWAMESYDAGQEFPIYGTCQGIQLLSMLTSGNAEIKEDCKVHATRACNAPGVGAR